jgi:hypothetical protein
MAAARATKAASDKLRQPATERWLVFVHQLPAHPSNARVKTWRRLHQIGAVAVKNAVHVLPNTAQALEDFEWLRTEVLAVGGQATIFTASSLSGIEEKQIIKQFNKLRAEEYGQLRKDIKALAKKADTTLRFDDRARQAVRALGDRLVETQQKDFFSAPGGREAETALGDLDVKARRTSLKRSALTAPANEAFDPRIYQQRTWITRPRPGVDRFGSAWLIRRFVDSRAMFVFAESPAKHPDAVPFDMYQSGGFRHEGDRCTFEVLQDRFRIKDTAVRRISEIVHDLDLKDDRYKHPHRAAIGALVDGLQRSIEDDGKLLEQGITLFEALYQSFQPPKQKSGGTPTA